MGSESMMSRAPSDKALNEPRLPSSRIVVWLTVMALTAFIGWAWYFHIAEVTTGSGRIVPSSNEQVVQSLEGGILKELLVKPGDIVERGQLVAKLDPVRAESSVGESHSQLLASLASAARLEAEVNDTDPVFPDELSGHQSLIDQEMRLYQSHRDTLVATVSGLEEEQRLIQREIDMTQPYVAKGAATEIDVLRLRREASELGNRIEDTRNQYYVKAREELAKERAEIESLRSVVRGRQDSLQRLDFVSPVRGIVKDIDVTTAGGVIPPNGKLMTIVPLEDQLLVEARISPRDVAFIHPGQHAEVKITAYDYSIYGGLDGEVTVISPDTIQDEVQRDTWYYQVYIRTDQAWLETRDGKQHPIVPGMITTVDIATGSRSVLDYLLKPFNKAREALRER